jgi:ABC-type dipeptide/oligopeptide/nickel transport system permease component
VKAYVLQRILLLVPVLVGVSLINFALMHAAPGGPFDFESLMSAQNRQTLVEYYGLDRPLWEQYLNYVSKALQGDFGYSFRFRNQPVAEIIAARFTVSLQLGIAAILVATLVGIPLGVLAAVYRNSWIDRLGMFASTVGFSVPNFVTSMLLILLLGLGLSLLPVGGWGTPQQMILPALALGLPWACLLARLARSAMLDEFSQPYVLVARAKGARRWYIVIVHMLRNALRPLVTVIGILTAEMITGSFVIETIFGIPGLGQYFITSILAADYPMIMGLALFYAVVVALMNLVVDLLYLAIDPRIRY